jgi:hypothetical protein
MQFILRTCHVELSASGIASVAVSLDEEKCASQTDELETLMMGQGECEFYGITGQLAGTPFIMHRHHGPETHIQNAWLVHSKVQGT